MYVVQLGIIVGMDKDQKEHSTIGANPFRIGVIDIVAISTDIDDRLTAVGDSEIMNVTYDLVYTELEADGLQKEIMVSKIFR